MPALPDDYELISDGSTTIVIKSGWKARLLEDLRNGFTAIPPAARRSFTGRARHFSYQPGGSSDRVLVRRIVRGGMIARLMGDLHWGMSRPFQEIAAVVRAQAAGLNVPEIVAVRSDRGALGFYRFTVVVKEVEGARDLLSLAGEASPSDRRRAIREVAETLRQMHEAGLYHGDLNLRNILVSSAGGRGTVHLIDLDRAILRRRRDASLDFRNLARLNRSVEKWLGRRVTRADKIRFLVGYLGQRDHLREAARRCGAGLWLHRLWWALTPT